MGTDSKTDFETIALRREGAVGVLALSRPDRMNAFTSTMAREMIAALEAYDADPEVRCILVEGEGRAFCAGADIETGFGGSLGTKDLPPLHGEVRRDAGGWLNLAIYGLDTAVVAGVHRAAVGIGFTMLLPMDVVIAARGTKMAVPFTRRGIVWDGGASWLLPRVVGLGYARDWSVSGRTFLAEEAHRAGMVSELADSDDAAKTRALEIATDIAQNCSPQSIAHNKRILREALGSGGGGASLFATHLRESEALNARFASADCQEGVESFFQKRAPHFAAHTKG